MKTKQRSKNQTLMIDTDFQRLLPQLQEAESRLLEESILANGIIDPIVVWRGYIVDGHNRVSIATKHKLQFSLRELPETMTKQQVMLWMAQYQLGKRNCNLFGKVEVALKFKENFSNEGKLNQKRAGKTKNKLCQRADEVKSTKVDALSMVGQIAGVSRNTVSQVQYILINAPEKIINKCRFGTLSIRNAYLKTGDIVRDNRRKTHNQESFAIENDKNSYLNSIICGDCIDVMEKMIEEGYKESITCIITSPPYNNGVDYGNNYDDSMPYQDYLNWIGKVFSTASKLLKIGGRVIINVSSMRNRQSEETFKHPINADLMHQITKTDCGLKFREEIIWHKYNGTTANIGKCRNPKNPTIKTVHEYLLIFCKEQWILPEKLTIESDLTSEEFEKYSQSVWNISSISHNQIHPASFPEELIIPLIKMFSFPDDIILDPFNGSGTTTLCAAKTGRRFIGIEQNPVYCKYAKNRITKKITPKYS